MQKSTQEVPTVNKANDYERINLYIKEFLKFNKYQSTLECLEAEERTKLVTSKKRQMNVHPEDSKNVDDFPRLYRFFESDSIANGREKRLDRDLKVLQNKNQNILQSARQIFSIAVNCL
jgi:hypothetical protein